jgi:ornithine cyclodeaminase
MPDNDVLILNGRDVLSLLTGRELEVMETVRAAYEAHGRNNSSLPHSTFLHFPRAPKNRIIALPAYLGEEFAVAGMKWVSSFPANIEAGLDRASAVLILNSAHTGRPEAILEGSLISAKRTAASAALAAQHLHRHAKRASIIGCGLINFEIVNYLLAACPLIEELHVFDLDRERAEHFKSKCLAAFSGIKVRVVKDVETALGRSSLISLATTAAKPHITDLSACAPGSTILHISLRDLSPQCILSSDNVVDDVDHVCRAQTSVHLTEQVCGHRDFIRCTLADILTGVAPPRRDPEGITIFSPFGLGVLDIAVGSLVRRLGRAQGLGTVIETFLPEPWVQAEELQPVRQA